MLIRFIFWQTLRDELVYNVAAKGIRHVKFDQSR